MIKPNYFIKVPADLPLLIQVLNMAQSTIFRHFHFTKYCNKHDFVNQFLMNITKNRVRSKLTALKVPAGLPFLVQSVRRDFKRIK